MLFVLSILCTIYLLGFVFSPFPYWKTYFILWHNILFNKKSRNYGISKFKQARFLMHYALFCPLWTFLWYLDELLYPHYHQKKIQPIFIIGQPRSGTTFLHRTLANDAEHFIAIRHIEWRYPYIIAQKLFHYFPCFKCWVSKNYWPNNATGQKVSKMHPNTLSDWEEDGIFFEECFLHHFFIFLRFPDIGLLSYLDDFQLLPKKTQKKMLRIHKKVIQKVIYLRKGSNQFYLSKEVTSHNKMKKIMLLYPDAKFIISARESSGYMNSLLELMRCSTQSKTNIDPIHIPEWESTFIKRMRKDSLLLVDLCEKEINKKDPIYVVFNVFTQDIIPSIEYIYRQLNCPISQSYRHYLEQLSITQQKRKKGYSYDKKYYKGFERFDEFIQNIQIHSKV